MPKSTATMLTFAKLSICAFAAIFMAQLTLEQAVFADKWFHQTLEIEHYINEENQR